MAPWGNAWLSRKQWLDPFFSLHRLMPLETSRAAELPRFPPLGMTPCPYTCRHYRCGVTCEAAPLKRCEETSEAPLLLPTSQGLTGRGMPRGLTQGSRRGRVYLGRDIGLTPGNTPPPAVHPSGLRRCSESWPDQSGLNCRLIPWGLQFQISPLWDGVGQGPSMSVLCLADPCAYRLGVEN